MPTRMEMADAGDKTMAARVKSAQTMAGRVESARGVVWLGLSDVTILSILSFDSYRALGCHWWERT